MVTMTAYSQKKKVLKSQIFSCQNRQKREFHAEGQKGAGPLRPLNFEGISNKFRSFPIKYPKFGTPFFVLAEQSRFADFNSSNQRELKGQNLQISIAQPKQKTVFQILDILWEMT